MKNKLFLLLVMLSQAFAKVENGLYVYEPDPFWGDIRWEQLIPLLKIGIPVLMAIGLPIIIVMAIMAVIKVPQQGAKIGWDLIKEFLPKKKENEHET